MSTKLRADDGEVSNILWRSASIAGTPQVPVPQARERRAEIATAPANDPEIQAKISAAREQGRLEGAAAATREAHQKLDPVIGQFMSLLAELAGERARVRRESEQDLVRLAVVIAKRVLHRELATDPEAIVGLVKAAFGKLNSREVNRLRVSPGDAAAVEQHRAGLHIPPGLELVRDSSLAPGSAIFETARGELDVSVDTQLAEIDRGLADTLSRKMK